MFRFHRRKHMYVIGVHGENEPRAWVISTSAIKAVKIAEQTVKGCSLDVLNRL